MLYFSEIHPLTVIFILCFVSLINYSNFIFFAQSKSVHWRHQNSCYSFSELRVLYRSGNTGVLKCFHGGSLWGKSGGVGVVNKSPNAILFTRKYFFRIIKNNFLELLLCFLRTALFSENMWGFKDLRGQTSSASRSAKLKDVPLCNRSTGPCYLNWIEIKWPFYLDFYFAHFLYEHGLFLQLVISKLP